MKNTYTFPVQAPATLPRRAYFQPAPDAMPVEVQILHSQNPRVVVVEAQHGQPFRLLTTAGYCLSNVAPVLAEHVRLLEVKA